MTARQSSIPADEKTCHVVRRSRDDLEAPPCRRHHDSLERADAGCQNRKQVQRQRKLRTVESLSFADETPCHAYRAVCMLASRPALGRAPAATQSKAARPPRCQPRSATKRSVSSHLTELCRVKGCLPDRRPSWRPALALCSCSGETSHPRELSLRAPRWMRWSSRSRRRKPFPAPTRAGDATRQCQQGSACQLACVVYDPLATKTTATKPRLRHSGVSLWHSAKRTLGVWLRAKLWKRPQQVL